MKIHLQVGKFSATDPLLESVWTLLERRGIPVVLHAGAVADGSGGEEWCGPEPVRRLLGDHPALRLVIAHLGAPDYDAFIDLALEHPAIGLDTANVFNDPPFLGEPPVHRRRDLVALGDRVYFGSDFPTIPRPFSAQLSTLAGLGWGDEWLAQGPVGQRRPSLRGGAGAGLAPDPPLPGLPLDRIGPPDPREGGIDEGQTLGGGIVVAAPPKAPHQGVASLARGRRRHLRPAGPAR